MPGNVPDGGLDGEGLPHPLTPSDAAKLRRIFALQDGGHLDDAATVLATVSDQILNGHVLAQRYLGRFTQATAAELAAWLAQNPDHPDAAAIHTVLLSRLRSGTLPASPQVASLAPAQTVGAVLEEDESGTVQLRRNAMLDRAVHKLARAGEAEAALRLLATARGIDPTYGGQLRAEVAQALFTQGADEQALRVAQDAVQRSGGRVALAGFIGGLAAWRLDRLEIARPLFDGASHASVNSTSLRAGAAFWAARAYRREGDIPASLPFMRQAAEARHTFYGLLARRMLGIADNRPAPRDTLGSADGAALLATAHGHRALALLQVGQPRRAEAELRCLWASVSGNAAMSGAVLRVAEAAGLTDLASQLAGLIEKSQGRMHDDARFPMPTLRPTGGFRVDPALIYALARLESNFEPDIVSRVGALGLMQLLPVTASYMSGDGGNALALNATRLRDPGTNLALGQTYLLYLASHDRVRNNLISLLASYNAGPTSFARMADAMPHSDDPLLFIESIPNPQTRGFVPRALTFLWIYAARLRLPSPSLDELAAGAWPSFQLQAPRHEQSARLH